VRAEKDGKPVRLFAMLPAEAATDHRLGAVHFRVLTAILIFQGKRANAYPSRRAICARTGDSERNVSRAASQLQRLGWLHIEGRGGRGKPNTYRVTVPEFAILAHAKAAEDYAKEPETVADVATVYEGETGNTVVPVCDKTPAYSEGVSEAKTPAKVAAGSDVKTETTVGAVSGAKTGTHVGAVSEEREAEPETDLKQTGTTVGAVKGVNRDNCWRGEKISLNKISKEKIISAAPASGAAPEGQGELLQKHPEPEPEPDPQEQQREACRKTWEAYAEAFANRYGVDPVRNAKVNTHVLQFVKRLGHAEAPAVASYYLTHNDSFYTKQQHAFGALLANAEGMRTQWATGRQMTSTRARQIDGTATTFNAVEEIIQDWRATQ